MLLESLKVIFSELRVSTINLSGQPNRQGQGNTVAIRNCTTKSRLMNTATQSHSKSKETHSQSKNNTTQVHTVKVMRTNYARPAEKAKRTCDTKMTTGPKLS